jgi:ParB-like chromosome segregation protein Spo0J
MNKTTLKISEIKNNPNNPRLIKDDNFKKLVQSIKDFPEMLEAREVVVNTDYIILGGNMRYKAAKEAGLKELPVKVVDWTEEQQRQFVIKDNISGGEWDWDLLANEWDKKELDDWGVDSVKTHFDDIDSFFEDSDDTDSKPKHTTCPECGHEFNA